MKRVLLLLSISAIVLSGCSIRVNINKENSAEENLWEMEDDFFYEAETGAIGLFAERIPKGVDSLTEAFTSSMTYKFSGGMTKQLTESNIISEATFGKLGILNIRMPDDALAFAVVTYSKEDEWMFQEYRVFNVGDSLGKQDHGLAFPSERMFAFEEDMSHRENLVKRWTLFNGSNVVNILVANHQFSVPPGSRVIREGSEDERFVLEQTKGNGLFFYDEDKVVLLTGNLSEEQLLALSDTLPRVSYELFPFKH